jgi:hypothetical protein
MKLNVRSTKTRLKYAIGGVLDGSVRNIEIPVHPEHITLPVFVELF